MNIKLLPIPIFVFLFFFNVNEIFAQPRQINTKPAASLNNKQLYFIENAGQVTDQHGNIRADIQYKVATPGMNLFIGNGQLHYQWSTIAKKEKRAELYRMDVTLAGANPKALVIAEDKQDYFETYRGHTIKTAHAVNKITYKNVYPHIDWVLYIKDSKVEYDFVVHEGGRVQDIQLQYGGATELKKTASGAIHALTPMGGVTELQPYSYEQYGKNAVTTSFKINGNKVSFDVAPYTGTLVIDPTLAWATYYGGTGSEQGNAVTCDQLGNVYMVGITTSTNNIATTGGYQNTLYATWEYTSFLVKFNSAGLRLWGTYFGGALATNDTSYNQATGVACDGLGNVYVAGFALDTNIVTTVGAYQRTKSSGEDAYIAQFSSLGALQWATYYGGTGYDQAFGIACDRNNNIFVTGITSSDGLATTGASQTTRGGVSDAFLVKFNSAGARQWATYLGGSNSEQGNGITCDTAGHIYITGQVNSTNFPSTYLCQQSLYGGGGNDAFVAKYNNAGTLQWATYYGGTDQDIATCIACADTNQIYITGYTISTNGIASGGSYQTTLGNFTNNSFLVKFDGTGSRTWGTYFGGASIVNSYGLVCDTGSVYITGGVQGPYGIATADAYQTAFGGGIVTDGFLEQFSRNGSRIWGTYYGGNGYDAAYGAAMDTKGHVYICGSTYSSLLNMPYGSFQRTYGGGLGDAFLAKFTFSDTVAYFAVPFAENCERTGATFNLPFNTTFPFHPGNTFIAQLSDSSGSFANPTNIGSIVATGTSIIQATIPTSLPSGTRYRYRIIATSPADTSLDDGSDATILNASLAYRTSVCKGDTIKIIQSSTSSITSRWTEPNGITATTNSIVIPNSVYTNGGLYRDVITFNGCTFNDSAAVAVNYTPTPLPSYNGPICINNNLNLFSADTNTHTTYLWSGPQSFTSTFSNPSIISAILADSGYYKITASVGSCSYTDSVKVVIQQTLGYLQVSGNDSICNGGTLALNVVTTTPNIGYSWTGPGSFTANTQSISVNPVSYADSGLYYVRATKSGCTSYADTIRVYVKPLPATPFVSSNTASLCAGTTLTLGATSAPADATFSWTGPAGFSSIIANPTRTNMVAADSGIYIVTAGLNKCSSSPVQIHVAVLPLPTGIGHVGVVNPCLGDSLHLSETSITTGVSYYWTDRASFTSTLRNPVTYTTTPGKYFVTVTSPNGCAVLDSVTISILPLPAAPIVNNNGPKCVGDTITLTSSDITPNVTYSWTGVNGFISSVQNPLAIKNVPIQDSGYYTVKARLSNGCTASSTTLVVINSKPAAPVLIYNGSVCTGGPISIIPATNITGATYTWTKPDGTNVPGSSLFITSPATAASAGKYYLKILTNGCTVLDTATISVHQAPAVPVLSSNGPVCAKSALSISAVPDTGTVTYSWLSPSNAHFNTSSFSISQALVTDSGLYILAVTQNGCTVMDSIIATVKTAPILSLSLGSNQVCAGASVNMTANATVGNPVWTGPNGFTSPLTNLLRTNLVPADSGIYVVSAAFNGCSSKDSVLLEVHGLPTHPILANRTPVCAGDTLKITGTSPKAGITYTWTGPAGYLATNQNVVIPHATAANMGSYYLQTNNGCVAYDTVNVIVTPLPVIGGVGSNSPICRGAQLLLLGGSVFPGNFSSWTGPAGYTSSVQNAIINNTPAVDSGIFVLHAINQGCTSTDTIHVSVGNINVSYTTNSPVCIGDTLKMTGSSTTPGVIYSWTRPDNTSLAQQNIVIPASTAANAGTYIFNVSNSSCIVHDTLVAVIKPIPVAPIATNNGPVCAGSSLNLSALSTTPGVTYKWTYPNATTNTSQNPIITNITTINAGLYAVRATLNSCTSAAGTTLVTVNPVPTAAVSSNSPVCLGSTLQFITTAPVGATFHWSGPNNFTNQLEDPAISNATSAAAGTYILSVSLNGCTGTTSVPVTITSNPSPAVSITIPHDTICKGDNAIFTANATNAGSAPAYLWRVNNLSTGVTTRTFPTSTLANNDMVVCNVVSNGTCQSTYNATSNTISMYVVASHPPPVTVTVYPSVFTPGILTTFTAITPGSSNCLTYQWKLNGIDIPGANSSSYESYTLNMGDKVTLYIHSTCACTSPDTLLTDPIGLAVNNVTAGNNYKIYPNPAHDEVTIQGPGSAAQIEVYDMSGKKLWLTPVQFNNGSVKLHLALPSGVYNMHITDEMGGGYMERLVIME